MVCGGRLALLVLLCSARAPCLRHRALRALPTAGAAGTSLQLALLAGHQSQQGPAFPRKGLRWCQGTEDRLEGSGREPRATPGRRGGGVCRGLLWGRQEERSVGREG